MNPVILSLVASLALVAGMRFEPEAPRPRASSSRIEAEFPALLSKTGYFTDLSALTMSEGFEPYQVNVPAWADGAHKQRFFRLPKGRSANFATDGAWQFPRDTVFLQTLILPLDEEQRRIETRVILQGKSGLSFATYVWRADQREADLVKDGRSLDINWDSGFLLWEVTPVAKCNECHNPETQSLLGLTTEQLNKNVAGHNQINAFQKRGLVRNVPEAPTALPSLVDPSDEAQPLGARARSYLDTNCSSCHRPGGNGSGVMDLRFDTAFEKTGLGPHKRIVVKGKPVRSWIYLRMIYDDHRKMPSLLTVHPDEKGSNLIFDWVESLEE